jgi:hypothetical protein
MEATLYILYDHNAKKLELNNKSSSRKYIKNWRLNNMLFNEQWVEEETRKEIKKFLKFNENEYTTYKNLLDIAKAVLRGKFIAMTPYIKNTEISQINDLMLHLKLQEKEEQAKSKTSKRREIIKIRAENNEIETKTINESM